MAAELGKAGLKVIGLERGPRLKTADFQLDELRYFQRKDLRPNPKLQPVTWRPNADTRGVPPAAAGLRHAGRRRHRALWRGVMAPARGRFPRPHQHDRALWRLRHSGGFLARRLAAELCAISSRSTTGSNTISASPARPATCRAARSTAAMCSRRRACAIIRCRRCTKDQPSILFEEGAKKLGHHPFSTPHAILSQPYKGRPGLHLLHLLPGVRLLYRRQVEHPGDQAAGGRRHRQFHAEHRRDVLPGQQQSGNRRHRRVLLRAGRLRQHHRGRDRHPRHASSTTIRACCCCRRPTVSRTGSPIPAGRSASTS